jgi:hypothetical protein
MSLPGTHDRFGVCNPGALPVPLPAVLIVLLASRAPCSESCAMVKAVATNSAFGGQYAHRPKTFRLRQILNTMNQAAAIAVLLVAGCVPKPADPSRFYAGPLAREDLVGCWVIAADSLPYLSQAGFRKYTNRLDHILLLNPDGSCVYRTFDYFTPDWFKETEEGRYDRFAGEDGRAVWGEDTAIASRSWYRLNPDGDPVIAGPFRNTNATPHGPAHLMKNCWDRWSLADSGKNVWKQFELEDPVGERFRYKVEFDNHTISSSLFWFVTKKDGRLFLWKPVYTRPGDAGWAYRDMVRFEKADMSELKE